jgi:subfamily B ATP-binding cassette protein MsbA
MIELLRTRLWPYIAPYRTRMIGIIFFAFIIALIGGAQTYLVKPLFDKGLSPDGTSEDAYKLAAALMALGLLNFPCRFFHFYWLRTIQDRATCAVREEVFQKLLVLPTTFFTKSKQGNLISHLINDANVFAGGFRAMIDLIREPLKATIYLSMAFWADWQLTLVIFFLAPFLILVFSISGKKVKNNQSFVQNEQGELTHNMAEGISSHKITKAFNLEHFVLKRFKNAQERYFGAQLKTTFVEEMAHPFVEVIGAMAFAGVIVFAHHRIQSGETTIGEFISFIAALALFMDPIRKFSQANVKLSQARAANERLQEVLGHEPERTTGSISDHYFSSSIEINNLTFSYGEAAVLRDLSLKIERGQKTAFVGLSGSGKSTLINLLLGLYPVSSGSIQIDGHDLNDYKLHTLRSQFGLVSQDIFLFNDTIRHNLCLDKDISEEKMTEALEVSYAKEFVDKLPQGLDTIIGDRGALLSGGQQQRITIARAYLQDAPILLFDEATSALDNESEKVVQKALDNLASDKTVIAVAHRLSTISHFDCIYLLSEGKLIEAGTHSELMAKQGGYAKLFALSS